MTATTRTRPARRVKRAPYTGPKCAACGYVTLVTPCARPECPRWAIVCGGCEEVAEAFVEADGRCEWCRVQ